MIELNALKQLRRYYPKTPVPNVKPREKNNLQYVECNNR